MHKIITTKIPNGKVNKLSLIHFISSENGIGQFAAKKSIERVIDAVIKILSAGGTITLMEFGKFSTKLIVLRKSHNPSTGKTIVIPTY